MYGIDLNKPLVYRNSSFRFFDPEEYHVTRCCEQDVLLLVFAGVLRFTEGGRPVEVHPGEYYIQKSNLFQSADRTSDTPKYLYIHFNGEWSDSDNSLPVRGVYSLQEMYSLMDKLDKYYHEGRNYTEQAAVFLTILSNLFSPQEKPPTLARKIALYMSENMASVSGLDEICGKFRYSKNHIINIFRDEYKKTPVEYLGEIRIKRAMCLAEVTSKPFILIAEEVGFNNYSHFYRLFKRITGFSPERWREMIRNR